MAILWLTTSCSHIEKKANDYDHFAGWYELQMPDRKQDDTNHPRPKIYVPVIKRGSEFCTPFVGHEVPFEKVEEGLYLKVDNSVQQQRMTIGYRPDSGKYYARIVRRSAYEDYSSPDRKHEGEIECSLTRTERPTDALDPTATPPSTLDDFVGWYEPAYLRGYHFAGILKKDSKFFLIGQKPGKKPDDKMQELKPCKMGFRVSTSDYFFRYNADLQRYEGCSTNEGFAVSMPLVRIDAPSTNEPMPFIWFGFPFKKD